MPFHRKKEQSKKGTGSRKKWIGEREREKQRRRRVTAAALLLYDHNDDYSLVDDDDDDVDVGHEDIVLLWLLLGMPGCIFLSTLIISHVLIFWREKKGLQGTIYDASGLAFTIKIYAMLNG